MAVRCMRHLSSMIWIACSTTIPLCGSWPLSGERETPGPFQPVNGSPTAGRPLVNLSFALNYAQGGFDPYSYRLFNIAIHTLSALLLGAVVARILRQPFFEGRFDNASGPVALAASLVWALHPLNTEAVVYITQRTELMMALFYLATLYCSLRYWSAALPAGKATWLAFAAASCAAGMASKEVMVSAPVVMLCYERTFVRGSFQAALRKSWPLYVALCSTWVLLVYLNIDRPRATSAGFDRNVATLSWWFTQAKVLALYLKLTVWPWPLLIHYHFPYLTTIASAWPWLLLASGLAVVAAIAFWRRTALGFVFVAVFATLSPTLLIPIVTEIAAERRMYLPLAAIVPLVVVGLYALVRRTYRAVVKPGTSERPMLVALAFASVAVGAAFCALDVRRLTAYDDVVALWQDVVARQPTDIIVRNGLASALIFAGRTSEAQSLLEETLRLDSGDAEGLVNLGLVLMREGKLDEAVADFKQAIHLKPDDAMAHNDLAAAYVKLGACRKRSPSLSKPKSSSQRRLAFTATSRRPLPRLVAQQKQSISTK